MTTPADLTPGKRYSLIDSRSYRWVQWVDDEYSLTKIPAFRTLFRWPDPKVLGTEPIDLSKFRKAWAAVDEDTGAAPLVVMED